MTTFHSSIFLISKSILPTPPGYLVAMGNQIAITNEDVSMDVTTSTFSPTQMILVWTLLGLLLTWFITFTVLALLAFITKKAEWEDWRKNGHSIYSDRAMR
jgi:hypothetical protein